MSFPRLHIRLAGAGFQDDETRETCRALLCNEKVIDGSSFRKYSLVHHPDKNIKASEDDVRKYKEVVSCWGDWQQEAKTVDCSTPSSSIFSSSSFSSSSSSSSASSSSSSSAAAQKTSEDYWRWSNSKEGQASRKKQDDDDKDFWKKRDVDNKEKRDKQKREWDEARARQVQTAAEQLGVPLQKFKEVIRDDNITNIYYKYMDESTRRSLYSLTERELAVFFVNIMSEIVRQLGLTVNDESIRNFTQILEEAEERRHQWAENATRGFPYQLYSMIRHFARSDRYSALIFRYGRRRADVDQKSGDAKDHRRSRSRSRSPEPEPVPDEKDDEWIAEMNEKLKNNKKLQHRWTINWSKQSQRYYYHDSKTNVKIWADESEPVEK